MRVLTSSSSLFSVLCFVVVFVWGIGIGCVHAVPLHILSMMPQDDPLSNLNAMETRTKEAWVKIMSAREARNDLRECYRREGVNHVDKCSEFAKAYLNAIQAPFFTVCGEICAGCHNSQDQSPCASTVLTTADDRAA